MPSVQADRGVVDAERARPALMLALLGADAMRRLRATHGGQDLSPRQFQILALLHDRGAMPQGALIAELHVAASILVTLLNPLEHTGLVRRDRDPDDRRRHLVRLTASGESALERASDAQRTVEDEILAPLDEADRRRLGELLGALRDGLTAGDPRCGTPASLEQFEPSSDDT